MPSSTSTVSVTEQTFDGPAHRTFYLESGPADGTPIIFVHGWPELSHSWRHQLPAFAARGFRCIAPDMRGYGRSSTYTDHTDYAQERVVGDMLALADHLGIKQTVWVGHDWGCATVWNVASHHPDRCHAVANLCVPYRTLERGLDAMVALVDRNVYPLAEFPVGQWDYQYHYQESFGAATAEMDSNPLNTVKALFRKGAPDGVGQPGLTSMIRRNGGWFSGLGGAPELPVDLDVVTEEDVAVYAGALARNGFFGANSYYMNHAANLAYADRATDGVQLSMPVLFVHARYDQTCETTNSPLAGPMRDYCDQLTEATIDCGHWMAQEQPARLNQILGDWLDSDVF